MGLQQGVVSCQLATEIKKVEANDLLQMGKLNSQDANGILAKYKWFGIDIITAKN